MLKEEKLRVSVPLLRPDNLQLAGNMYKVVGISLRREAALIRLLNKVLVALFVRKGNSIFLALELYALAVHEVGGGLPAHEGILPPTTLCERVPIHEPAEAMPVAGLCCCFCGTVDPELVVVNCEGVRRDKVE
jgi:hypothetical protein